MFPWERKDRFLRILEQPEFKQLVILQDGLLHDSAAYWASRGAKFVHLPLTTTSVSSPMGLGSDSKPLAVEIAGERCYLADSMQFLLEYACRFSENGTWYIMPSFRAENSDETHLNEFFHSEAEIPGSLDDVLTEVEGYLHTITQGAIERMRNCPVEDQSLQHVEDFLTRKEIPRITFDQAVRILESDPKFIEIHESWRTITRAGEQRLIEVYGGATWLTHFDHLAVPFYQAFSGPDRRTASNADLLCGLGEMIGAGERHATGSQVREALKLHGVPESDYEWYVSLKDSYPLRTSGFGLGVERWLQWLTQTADIRNLQLVPRIHGMRTAP